MSTTLDLDQMTTEEKLAAMEELWANLTSNQREFESPPWHETVLREREERSRNGLETPIDWQEAKEELRGRFK
jgi:Putative addiction module component